MANEAHKIIRSNFTNEHKNKLNINFSEKGKSWQCGINVIRSTVVMKF